MGFLGSMFSSDQGMGYRPQGGASVEQAQDLYNQQQQRLAQQQQFTQALMAQSPQAIANQQMLGSQLAAATQGIGPSVAQTQLAETTGQNVKRQGALMQSTRGASGNVGLMSRNIANVGAQTQQQAAGQAATLRAQEILAARQQLQGLTGAQLGQIGQAQQTGLVGTTNAQQNILNAIAQKNATEAGIQQQIAQGQGGLLQGLMGGMMMLADGGEVTQEPSNEKSYWEKFKESYANQAKQAMNTPSESKTFEGGRAMGQAMAKGVGSLFKSKPDTGTPGGGYAGANLNVNTAMPTPINPLATSQSIGALKLPFLGMAEGGKVPAMVSPGERYLPPSEVEKVKKGEKEAVHAGKKIPGKAKVDGDNLQNDTVHATLKEGGIVIPRSVMQSDDPAEQARKFVAAVLAKKQAKRK
jgi:hypothetical protein